MELMTWAVDVLGVWAREGGREGGRAGKEEEEEEWKEEAKDLGFALTRLRPVRR